MSKTRSQPAGARRPSRGFRRLAALLLCALSAAGDLPLQLASALAQDATTLAAPQTDTAGQAESAPAGSSNAHSPSTDQAAKKPREDLDSLLAKKGTLILREGTLADWMLAIQKTWNVDIVYDNEALQREQFTGALNDTSLKDILDTILPAKNYGYRRQNNAIVIVPLESMGEMARPNQKLELIEMEFVRPEEVEPTLKYLLSPQGKTQAIPSSNMLMVIDHQENIAAIQDYIRKLDQRAERNAQKAAANAAPNQSSASQTPDLPPPVERTITTVLRPTFVLAENLVETVQSQIADGTVTTVEEMNALVVTGSESAIQTASQVVQKLDVVQKQVRISVLMYDIRIDALEQLGVNWRNAGKGRISANGVPSSLFDLHAAPLSFGGTTAATGTTGGTGGTTGGTGTTTGAGSFVTSAAPNVVGSALTLTHLSRHFDISGVIQALDQTDGARLLARPSIRCYDRTQSEIKIISEIPVQQLTQTEMGGSIGTTTFREAGVSLRVTPYIGEGDEILMDLSPEFSVLTGFQNGQPIIDRRMQTQRVAVHSGDTLVLGGLRRKNELETVAGVPGLMNLKYVGNLFRSHRTTVEESELVTFIHTEIIEMDDPGLPREQVAAQIVCETLDQIPVASHTPYIPPCNDPYCPLHNPRPKYWPGNILGPEVCPATMPDAMPSSPDGPAYESLPPAAAEPVQAPRPAPAPTPMPPSPTANGDDDEEVVPRGARRAPPPVVIDEMAKRPAPNRLTMRRLPAPEAESAVKRLPAVAPPETTRMATRPLPPISEPRPSAPWQQLR